MKMIIAINNKIITQRLSAHYCINYNVYIVESKELVITMIEKDEECVVVIREDLKGNIDFLDLVENVHQKSSNVKFVVLVKELTQEYKEQLLSKEIFNIIEGKKFLFDELVENIDSPKMIVYKNKKVDLKNNVVIVTGISGSGKTTIARIIAKHIPKDKSVLVMDMDFVTPTLDLYLQNTKNYSLVDYIKDVMSNKIKKKESYETVDNKNKNIRYILNCKSIGIPKESVVVSMIEKIKDKYDYILIDTSSLMINQMCNVAQECNAYIVFVIEENEKAIRSFNIATSSVDKNILMNSKLVINKHKRNKKLNEEIKNNIPLEIYGYVYNKRRKIKCKLNKLLKAINAIKYIKLKNRLLDKILKIEEE